jgi:hypothetical protein
MIKTTLTAFIAFMLTASAGGVAATAETTTQATAQLFDVSMVIHDNDRLIAQPRLRVAAGELGRIEMEPGDGSHYRLGFSVIGISNELVDFSSAIDVQSAGRSKFTRMQATPRLTLRTGETGQIMLGDERHSVGPFTTDIVIRPVS